MTRIARTIQRSMALLAATTSLAVACTSGSDPLGTIRFQVDEGCPSCICTEYCIDQVDVQLWREGDLVPSATETGSCGEDLVFGGLLAGSAFKLHVFMSRDGTTILSGISETAVVVKDETEIASVSLALADPNAQPALAGLVTDPILVNTEDSSLLVAQLGDLGSGSENGTPSLSLDSVPLETSELGASTLSSLLPLEDVQDTPGTAPEVTISVCGISSDPLPLRILTEEPPIRDHDPLVCSGKELTVAKTYGTSGANGSESGFVVGCATSTGGRITHISDTSCLAFDQVELDEEPTALSVSPDGGSACALTQGASDIHQINFEDGSVTTQSLGDGMEGIAISSIDGLCFALLENQSDGKVSLVEFNGSEVSAPPGVPGLIHKEIYATEASLWILSTESTVTDESFVIHYNRASGFVTQIPLNDCTNAQHLAISRDESRFAVVCPDPPNSVQILHVDAQEDVSWQSDTPSGALVALSWDLEGDVLFARTAESIFVLQHNLSVSPSEIEQLVQWGVPTGANKTFMIGFSNDDRLLLEGEEPGEFRTLRSYAGVPECKNR